MRRFSYRQLVLMTALFGALPVTERGIAQDTSTLTIEDYDSISQLSSTSLSRDGTRVAVIISHIDRSANARVNELAIVGTAGGAPLVIAKGKVGAPSWSPDGETLAWIASDEAGVRQIYLASRNALTQPRKLDAATRAGGIQRYVWSPDGRSIAYLTSPPALATPDKSFEIADADYLGTSYLARDNGGPPAQLWVMAVDSGERRRIDRVTGFPQDLAWRSDGKALFVQTQPGASVAATPSSSLLSVPIDGGAVEVMIDSPARIGTGSQLRTSGNGAIAFQHFRGSDPWTQANDVAVFRNSKLRVISNGLDRQIDDFRWLPGSNGILVRADDHVRTRLWRISEGGSVTALDLGALTAVSSFDVNARAAITFVGGSASGPRDLYYMASVRARPVRLTRLGDSLAGKRLGKVERFAWNYGGFDHDGVLVYPPAYDRAKSYPLLVDIHGGPELSSNEAFNFSAQYYAANGWVVFQPNYRGSTGQGNAYQNAITGNLIEGSGQDILAGVDKVSGALPIDRKRIAVSGWSWGGVLTNWLIGHDQRWCAAIPGALAVDFTAYYDQSETAIWMKSMLGSPYVGDNLEAYQKASPRTYLNRAITPTLIIHNVGDPNAPVTQSYSLYHALKDNGVKVKMLLRGIDGHGYGDPFSYRQVHTSTLAWLQDNCAELKQ